MLGQRAGRDITDKPVAVPQKLPATTLKKKIANLDKVKFENG